MAVVNLFSGSRCNWELRMGTLLGILLERDRGPMMCGDCNIRQGRVNAPLLKEFCFLISLGSQIYFNESDWEWV